MIDLEKYKLTAKQEAFVITYCDSGSETYNNAYQSAIKAGYAHNTAKNADKLILDNNGVKEALKAYKAKLAKKLDHNRDIAIKHLMHDYECLTEKAEQGDTVAIQARTSIMRELSAISNLHSSTVNTGHITEPAKLTEKERAELKRAAIKLTG